jgi:DNA-damage-inducible protein J
MIHIRLDDQLKTDATDALSAMGLSVSDAVRVFLTRVAVEKRLPFTIRVPNAETRKAMKETDEIMQSRRIRFHNAEEMFDELEKNR